MKHLRRDMGRGWDERTRGGAPHKPLMLLAILDLVDAGDITGDLIPYDQTLLQAFDLRWRALMGDALTNPLQPFWHLRSSEFWILEPNQGFAEALQHHSGLPSLKAFQSMVRGVRLREDVLKAVQTPEGRAELRSLLLDTYFSEGVRPLLLRAGETYVASKGFEEAFREASLREFQEVFDGRDGLDPAFINESRDLAFRRIVLPAYQHQCAACGAKLFTPAGRCMVQAAHIIPFSRSRNDDPRNGLALCPLHHWAFDQGMLGIRDGLVWMVHRHAKELPADPAYLSLHGRPVTLPSEGHLSPAPQAVAWHRKHIFEKIG